MSSCIGSGIGLYKCVLFFIVYYQMPFCSLQLNLTLKPITSDSVHCQVLASFSTGIFSCFTTIQGFDPPQLSCGAFFEFFLYCMHSHCFTIHSTAFGRGLQNCQLVDYKQVWKFCFSTYVSVAQKSKTDEPCVQLVCCCTCRLPTLL